MEVRSEQGLMAGRDLFGIPKGPPAPAPGPPSSAAMQSVRMAYTTDGTPVFAPVSSSAAPPGAAHGASMSAAAVAGGNGTAAPPGMGEPMAKKKRGRPRKYGPDGSMSLALVPASVATGSPAMAQGSSGPFSPAGSNPANPVPALSRDGVKKRGRPKGSTNKPREDAIGSPGVGFTPHVIKVQAGEDVSAKIMSFSQHGTRAVCVLSANGAISNVTLRQTATSGGTVTYEGRFEILSLSGSFLLTENGGQRSRTGGLSVSLAGPDGRLLGGGVAGLLIAASPVQIVVGSFNADRKKEPKQHAPSEPASAPPKVAVTTGMGPNSPPSRGTLSESSGGAGSPPPLHQGMAASNNNQPQILSSMPWK
ncbi:AT-hook motif nuclear-localized protein 10-like [Phragmites australis]|uniref:AT-hook motif nuclear-localized protein 10-like n=1 Tax=Phragmites australis TaxID=29695 RepID=UPI002D7799A5|nr:AT-hook motif nuclear-localized protein 10-like [Phragmites australis]XP_062195716.1 AT-hook motif nuclear-localized protein 10-like [Phragmites australis]XP_062195717.1 AT-hook motif nuclear-localized protein 10-like [Phragmites australis]